MISGGEKADEGCHQSTNSTESDLTIHDNTNPAELYLLRLLIMRIEHCFADRKAAITIDPIRKPVTWRGLSSEELQIIDCTGFAGHVEKTYNEVKGRVRNYEREQISQKV